MSYPTKETKLKVVAAYKAGNSISHLVEIFGYHRNTISRWIETAKRDPLFLRRKRPGSGRPPRLADKSAARLLKIISSPASKYGFETDFWTVARIRRVCRELLNVRVSKSALHRVLIKFEQSYKKPQKQYFEACEEKQGHWIKNELVQIKKILKNKNAILYFEDESSIELSPVLAKTWGPIGKKIIQKATANRGSVSAISAISSSGNLIFKIHKAGKRFGASDIVKFLSSMLDHHPRRHLVVVMDQAPCHRAKMVQNYVASQKRLHVFYLPPRSPEFNPDEKV